MDTEGGQHALYGVEARMCVWSQCLVQTFTAETGYFGDTAHAARTRNGAKRLLEVACITCCKRFAQIGGDCFVVQKIVGWIEGSGLQSIHGGPVNEVD